MIIQLQFIEIMGCANLFQRFLTLAVYCVSTPSILTLITDELKFLIPITLLDMTTITVIDHGMSLSVL
jgi:hypothetical protein